MQRAIRQEQQRDDESLRPIATQEDLGKVLESDTDRREGDPEHRHEEPEGEGGRGPVPSGCDAISKRPRKSATHPTRTMRTPQTRNASSVMLGRVRSIPLVEGRENHLVSVGRSPRDRVPKAFMAYAANRPFRSRSLVRSRIGAFRASDAGS